jgi:hypothetical protein
MDFFIYSIVYTVNPTKVIVFNPFFYCEMAEARQSFTTVDGIPNYELN